MSIIDHLLEIIAPHECVACAAEGANLCGTCRASLPSVVPRCYRCHKYNEANRTCSSCRRQSKIFAAHALTQYDASAKLLVWRLKFGRAQKSGEEIGDMLSPIVEKVRQENSIIVPVPTATSRVRQRGYDQAVLIAKAISLRTGVPYISPVSRTGQQMQRGANRARRKQQLEGAFRVVSPYAVEGMHVILVDDVITTGATLEAVAAALRKAGAMRVEAVVFARA